MKTEWIIVDGYNMIHQEADGASLMERDPFLARRHLIRFLEDAVPALAEKITVVFDGRNGRGEVDRFETSVVEVRFSPASSSADSVIEGLVANDAKPARILVVTSDNLEANAVSGSGAAAIRCEYFIDQIKSLRKRSGAVRATSGKRRSPGLGTIGDVFPKRDSS